MKHVHFVAGLVLLLALLPGGAGIAAAALAPSTVSPWSDRSTDPAGRLASTANVTTAAEPTTTVGKFGAGFVVGGLQQAFRPSLGLTANQAGVVWSREDIHWNHIETSPGTYVWSDRDNAIDTLTASGVQIVGNIIYTPTFYSSNPGAANPAIYPPTSAAALNAYSTFVSLAVNRYKDRVHYWQIWGSVEDPTVYGPAPGGLNEYITFLRLANTAIKTADPSATIVMANARGSFLNPFLDAGMGIYVDAFSMSNYPIFDNPASPTTPIPEASRLLWRTDLIRDIVQRRGSGKPLWISEFDWASVPPARPAINETDQAAYMIRAFLLQEARPNIGRVFWAFFTDDTAANFGMLAHLDASRKLAFDTYKAMTTALAGASFTAQQPFQSTSTQVLENFEGGQVYAVNPFGSASGSFSRVSSPVHSGSQAGKITYSWTSANASGLNVQPQPTLQLPVTGSPSRFHVWARGDGGPGVAIGFSFTDATNRFCNALVGVVNGTDWKQYSGFFDAPDGKTSMVTCGGQDGITINFPIVVNGIAISGSDDIAPSASGTVYIDDLTFESGPTIFDLLYTSPANQTHAIWSLQGTPTFNLQTGATSVTVRDWRNTVTTVPVVNGVAAISASYHPVFVSLPSPAQLCSDRPRVTISTARNGAGAIVATIRATTSTTLLSNQIQSIQVGAATNASIDLGTRTSQAGNFTETINAAATTLTFRRANGFGAAQVPLVVTDACGAWRTFVGGGPSAF